MNLLNKYPKSPEEIGPNINMFSIIAPEVVNVPTNGVYIKKVNYIDNFSEHNNYNYYRFKLNKPHVIGHRKIKANDDFGEVHLTTDELQNQIIQVNLPTVIDKESGYESIPPIRLYSSPEQLGTIYNLGPALTRSMASKAIFDTLAGLPHEDLKDTTNELNNLRKRVIASFALSKSNIVVPGLLIAS